MPYFGLGLFIGDIENDSQVGPTPPDFLQVEAGQFLAFDQEIK